MSANLQILSYKPLIFGNHVKKVRKRYVRSINNFHCILGNLILLLKYHLISLKFKFFIRILEKSKI